MADFNRENWTQAVCVQCGQNFLQTRRNRKFCTGTCRYRYCIANKDSAMREKLRQVVEQPAEQPAAKKPAPKKPAAKKPAAKKPAPKKPAAIASGKGGKK